MWSANAPEQDVQASTEVVDAQFSVGPTGAANVDTETAAKPVATTKCLIMLMLLLDGEMLIEKQAYRVSGRSLGPRTSQLDQFANITGLAVAAALRLVADRLREP